MPQAELKGKGDSTKTTFRQLSGGRFRCIQTGVVVSRQGAKSYRHSRNCQLLHDENRHLFPRETHPPQPVAARVTPLVSQSPIPSSNIDSEGYVRCPYPGCGQYAYVPNAQTVMCSRCLGKFHAVALTIRFARIDNEGDVQCPYCGRWHMNASSREYACDLCNKRFIARR